MEIVLHANGYPDAGGSSMLMHNERLADPLDSIVRQLASFTSKRKKTEEDHKEIGRLEFHGGLYTVPVIEVENGKIVAPEITVVIVPAWNVLRCLQDGAKRRKRGPDVLRGVYPIAGQDAVLEYDGPKDPAGLWKQSYWLRKTVGVQRARTVRTRPMFDGWKFDLPVEVDPTIWDIDTLREIWHDSGIYCGIGDMRPVYGRFDGTITEVATT